MTRSTIGTIEGRPVAALELTGEHGLRLRLLDWGARLAELHVADAQGRVTDIVLGHDQAAEWEVSSAFFGATCGRYANRIAGSAFTLDGRQVRLDPNEGVNHLHGGARGFDRRFWTIERHEARLAEFSLISDDGDMGYPGRLEARARYEIDEGNRLKITLSATCDADTVVNLVNHAYFNLAGNGDVMGQHLRLHARHWLPVDEGLIPTGEVLASTDTAFDFGTLRPIGQALPGAGGFDHNLCLSEPLASLAGEMLRPCAEAHDPASGRRFRLWTDQPGVQFYSGGGLSGLPPGKGGQTIPRFGGFCLETQRFPDSPNKPQFPSATLRAGEGYRHVMLFDFTPAGA